MIRLHEELCSEDVYKKLIELGVKMTCAYNDIYTVHLNAYGQNFKTLHETADSVRNELIGHIDTVFEMASEGNVDVPNINEAIKDSGWEPITTGYIEQKDGINHIIEALKIVEDFLVGVRNMDGATSDVQSELDAIDRSLEHYSNYLLRRVTKEGVMSNYIHKNKKRFVNRQITEKVEKLKVGQPYQDFLTIEDHIEDYNIDLETVKKGDYILRDYQYGHYPQGGTQGWIPYEVVDIVYDDTVDDMGYHDRRKRIEITDGKEMYYIVAENGRFNGEYHKLYKSSINKD